MVPIEAPTAPKGLILSPRQQSLEDTLWSSTPGIDRWADGHLPDMATGGSKDPRLSPSKDGEPCWVRTSDLLIKSQLLYRLS